MPDIDIGMLISELHMLLLTDEERELTIDDLTQEDWSKLSDIAQTVDRVSAKREP